MAVPGVFTTVKDEFSDVVAPKFMANGNCRHCVCSQQYCHCAFKDNNASPKSLVMAIEAPSPSAIGLADTDTAFGTGWFLAGTKAPATSSTADLIFNLVQLD